MKKLLFTAYTLDVGGIETALVNLLNHLDYTKYDVTLILMKKEGIFLNQIPKKVKVLEYKISDNKNIVFRKIYNRVKLIKWQKELKNKFDFSCSFATYSIPGAYLALAASSNNVLWMHGNYYILYNRNEKAMQEFLDTVFIKKFKRIVFVSEENKKDVCNHYEGIIDKSFVCNNFIDGDAILKKAKEKIDFQKPECPLFINVGRHDEYQKRLTRIIEATKLLKEDGYKFKVLFIGDGNDRNLYEELVKKNKLEETIIFLGKKDNPFPYYKLSDAVVLSSEYEGYPVVFLEAMLMKKVILSTKVSDYEELDKIYGNFCELSTDGVYKNMKDYLDNGFKIKNKFDYKDYNKKIEDKINSFINDNI